MKNKKYITTDKHPEFKEGIKIVQTSGKIEKEEMFRDLSGLWNAAKYIIDNALEKGYIKEVQEPEFTRDDMIGFGKTLQGYDCEVGDCLDAWIKDNK